MWYKNIAGKFFGLVTKHACDGHTDRWTDGRTDRQTDRITTPKTALSIARAVKMGYQLPASVVSMVAIYNIPLFFSYAFTYFVILDIISDKQWRRSSLAINHFV